MHLLQEFGIPEISPLVLPLPLVNIQQNLCYDDDKQFEGKKKSAVIYRSLNKPRIKKGEKTHAHISAY